MWSFLPCINSVVIAVLLLQLLPALCDAQQFADLPLPVTWPGISYRCYEALNSTVSCPAFLGVVSVDNERLNAERIAALCVDSCLSSLNTVRQTIQQSCTGPSDKIIYDDFTYPATYIIDRFIYTHRLSCRRDPSTGEACDTLLISWLDQEELTASQECSDCLLGSAQTQLNSPFGYDDEFAEEFRSQTASCGASNYAFTSPPPYSQKNSATGTPTSSPAEPAASCPSPYTVVAGDTCNSIAQAKSVSTYSVIGPNGLFPNCENLVAGAAICLSSPCALYRVQADDTCANIIQGKGISSTQLLAWNANINALCSNLYDLKGTYICVGAPGGPLSQVSLSTPLAVSTATSPVPKPTNAPDGSNSNCARWYTIQEGDYCERISITFGITLKDFYFLNTEINAECTNLLLGLAYCIQAVGDIAKYPGYVTTQAYYTLTSNTYSTVTTRTATGDPIPRVTAAPQLPTAPGTVAGCAAYRNHRVIPPVLDQSESSQTSLMSDFVNSCVYLAGTYGVEIGDLVTWNPSLSAENCTLQEGFSYCVLMGSSSDSPTPNSNICQQVDTIKEGTISTCSCFTEVYGYDSGSYTCEGLAEDFGTSIADLLSWNPWLGSDCNTGLYADLAADAKNAVCIGVNSTTSPSPTTTTPPGPTQTGIVSACTRYHLVQSGDSCAAIQAQYSITFTQFLAWNPAVGSNCEALWLGYAYCVAAPTSSPTTAPPSDPTHGPLRPGTPETCTTYYTVQSGDWCAKITDQYGITFETFYRWNPSVGSNCEGLWVGYGVCVAGGPTA